MKGLIKYFAIAAVIAVTTGAFMAGSALESHYDEELTKVLNAQPYRPDWKGPAPLYYVNDGRPVYEPVGGARIYVGIGDPTGKIRGDFERSGKIKLCEGFSREFGIQNGRASLVVIYDPKTNAYRAFSSRHNLYGNFSYYFELGDFSLYGSLAAERLPIEAFKRIMSGETRGCYFSRNIKNLSEKEVRGIASFNQRYQ